MNWFKENPIPTAAAGVAILAMGALTFLALSAAQSTADAMAEFETESRQLQALKNQKPYPSQSNLDALKASVAAYQTSLNELKKTLANLDEPTNASSPQGFQDALRKAVDGLASDALKNNVALPEGFYLGFDEFRTRLPSQEEAPELASEFNVLNAVASQLVGINGLRIDSLSRLPSPPSPKGAESPILKKRFSISFTTTQEELIKAFNLITRSNRFLVIRSASFENSNPTPPPKALPGTASAQAGTPSQTQPLRPMRPGSPSTPASNQPASKDTRLDVVLGEETVTATLLVEILTFPDPKEPAAPEPTP